MQHDPAPYIIFAALLGAMIGFFGCALFASRRIKEDTRDAYWDGYYAANRENAAHNDHHHLVPDLPRGSGLIHEFSTDELRADQNQVLAESWLHRSSL